MPAVLLALALLVLPGAAERLGLAPDDESLRIPLVFAALALLVVLPPRGKPSRATRAAAALAGLPLLLALLGSLAGSERPAETPTSLLGMPYLPLALAASILVGARALGDAESRRRIALAATVVGGAAGVWIVVERLLGGPAVGPFGRPGVAGPTMAALGALAVVAAFEERRLRLTEATFAYAFTMAGTVATGSRTAWVALLAVGALAFLVRLGRRRALVAGAVAFVVIAAVGGLVALRSDTVAVRVGLAKASAALVAENPVVGHGVYGFASDVLAVRDLEEARISAGGRPLAAHNDVLHAAAEGGVLSGLAVAALLALALGVAARRVRRAPPSERAGLASLAAVVVVVAIASLAEDPLLASSTVVLFGLAVGSLTAAPLEETQGARSPKGVLRAVGLAMGVVAALHMAALVTDDASRLDDGSFRASEPLRARAYRQAVASARMGQFEEARRRYERLLAWDPGATEARLDLAEIDRLRGDATSARASLDQARRLDATRFDVPHRIGHLLLGDEPPPSGRGAAADAEAVLRAYNDAAALAPGRFETQVAYARVHRRAGRMKEADAALEQAFRAAKARDQGTPAELLMEIFRMGEAVGASPRVASHALAVALSAGPRAGGEIRDEAERFLEEAGRLDRAAKRAAEAAKASRDAGDASAAASNDAAAAAATKAAAADRNAASIRLAGLVEARSPWSDALRTAAHGLGGHPDETSRRDALAIYRALLSDPFGAADTALVLEARAVAAPLDRDLADQFGARARTLLGYEALAKGDAAKAEFEFAGAVKRDGGAISAHVGHARAVLRQGRADEAVSDLERAVKLDPGCYDDIARIEELRDVLAKIPRPPPK